MPVIIKKIDESFIEIRNFDKTILSKLKSKFTFKVPGYRFSPKYKSGYWDGNICLFDTRTNRLPLGLAIEAYKIVKSCTTDIVCDLNIFDKGFEITEREILNFCDLIKFPFTPYPHQIDAVQKILKQKRIVEVSATNSGKSAILFLICNLLKLKRQNEKILILVPTTQLVEQMSSDFIEYAKNHTHFGKYIKKVYSDMDKDLKCVLDDNRDEYIVISTWQSNKVLEPYFKSFTTVITDECHTATGQVLTNCVNKCVNADYKIGVTGSLSNEKIHELQLNGLFGSTEHIITAREMIDNGMSAEFDVRPIILDYPVDKRINLKNQIDLINKKLKQYEIRRYIKEMDFIKGDPERSKFVVDFLDKTKGNTIALFKTIDYGMQIYKDLFKQSKKRIFYIDGTVKVEKREEIRRMMEKYDNCVLLGSLGCISTGINIKNIFNAVLIESFKSEIKLVQTIGRILRKLPDKKAILFDIVDDISVRNFTNYSVRHWKKRMQIYKTQKHEVKNLKIKIQPHAL